MKYKTQVATMLQSVTDIISGTTGNKTSAKKEPSPTNGLYTEPLKRKSATNSSQVMDFTEVIHI